MTITHEALVYEYKKSGFAEIGGGFYSKVYAKPGTDWCIKVGRQIDGYLAFVQLAVKEGWIGTHAPYIYSIRVVDGFYITTMERLAVCLNDAPGELRGAARRQQGSDDWRQRLDMICNHADAIRHREPDSDIRDDTHGWNWMLRKDASLVLIDPIAGVTRKPIMTHWRNPNPRPAITPHPALAGY